MVSLYRWDSDPLGVDEEFQHFRAWRIPSSWAYLAPSNSNFRILGKFSEKNFSPMAIAELYNRVNSFYRHAFFGGAENIDREVVSGGLDFLSTMWYIFILQYGKK